ncbi:MAG: type III pantothenate kinase, partial [Prevotella sp.]
RYAFSKGICSTVAGIDEDAKRIMSALPFDIMPFESGKTPVPVSSSYKTPLTLGADRLAAVVGANWLQPGHDILVIDIGTCITFDFINASGVYEGGNISLGPTMRLRALHEFTARLPLVERKGETSSLGQSTEMSIRNGVVLGIKYEIEGYIGQMLEKHPHLFVYLTGGVHMDLHFSERIHIFANNFIVPIGLNRILEYNQ